MNGILAPQLIPLILEKLEDKDLYAYGWINQKSFEEANQIWYRKCVEPKEDYFKTYTEQKYNRLTHILNQLLLKI